MTDILIEYARERVKALQNSKNVVFQVRDIIRKFDKSARIFHFGSTLRGDWNAYSDIDVLVILNDQSVRDSITVEVFQQLNAPVELHFCTGEQFRSWYMKFIDVYEEL